MTRWTRTWGLALLALLAGGPAGAVSVDARLERTTISLGESTTLVLTVEGGQATENPRFDLPAGLELLGSGQSRSMTWTNGTFSGSTIYRYEIGATAPGHYSLGPILVRVGRQVWKSGVLSLEVAAAAARVPARGTGPADLLVTVEPRDPYVGQPMVLRVRLVQRIAFAEDPEYSPPVTTGFWSDRPSAPESFYADQSGAQVLVTETRTRLYPLASGPATIGEATATVVLGSPRDPTDPLSWLGGGVARRTVQVIRSRPVRVTVRPLPGGAPAAFAGAVGRYELAWTADRGRTSRDVPITLRLDVRGTGNLPLVRAPVLDDPNLEVFAATVEDSLGGPSGSGAGRKRFQWTVLARRQGNLELSAPEFVWFDPAAGQYRGQNPPPVRLAVGPALLKGAGSPSLLPPVFARRPIDPGEQPPRPWGCAVAGVALGAAIAAWRGSRRGLVHGGHRDRVLAWPRALETTSGSAFWQVADEACAWLEESEARKASGARDGMLEALRSRISAARYGQGGGDPEAVRRVMSERLSKALPPAATGLGLRTAAVALALAAVAGAIVFGPHAGDDRDEARARAADQLARSGDLDRARSAWYALWREGRRHPGLAARLAWGAIEAGDVGHAALWVLRGERVAGRDPGITWVGERVREGGGLVGAQPLRLPVTSLEWSFAAALFGLAAALAWPRARLAALFALVTLVASGAEPAAAWLLARHPPVVVVRAVGLEGADIGLEPGQVVRVRGSNGDRLLIRAGRVAEGRVPRSAVESLGR